MSTTLGYLPARIDRWLSMRRYAVPRSMIEGASARREVGDWRGACAAARFEVAFDLDGLRRRHGRTFAGRLLTDLRHLAPDLLRWHLPRAVSRWTPLVPDLVVPLAVYRTARGELWLRLCTPPRPGRQWPRLEVAASPGTDGFPYHAGRHRWDVRCAGDLRVRLGGDARRAPFFTPDGAALATALRRDGPHHSDAAAHTEWITTRGSAAAAAAGIPAPPWSDILLHAWFRTMTEDPAAWARLPGEARAVLAAHPGARSLEIARAGRLVVVLDGLPAGAPRLRAANPAGAAGLPRLDVRVWARQPDLELVRLGRLGPDELHPLVAAALFPRRAPSPGPRGPVAPWPVPVDCNGVRHIVALRPGGLVALAHTAEEQRRESALRALGGPVRGCFAVQRAWLDGRTAPPGLARLLDDLWARAHHGDTIGVLHLLDLGVPARVLSDTGRSLMHLLAEHDHRVLLPRLLAAGLSPNVLDARGQTPLDVARAHHAPADLVEALVAAGGRHRWTTG